MAIRILRGGSAYPGIFLGPVVAEKGYPTTANGCADEIACGPGEAVVQIEAGSPHFFATWLAGPIAEVTAELRRRNKTLLAEGLAALALPEPTPLAQLAHALGVPTSKLVKACDVAGCAVSRAERHES